MKNTIKNKIKNYYLYSTAPLRRKKILNPDVTIISNNCWGGMVSKTYDLKYNSPTVGCFFMAEDYIVFLRNLSDFLKADVNFISFTESKWVSYFNENNKIIDCPIMQLKYMDETIEIFMLHYKTEEEAREKWNRRKERVNLHNMIIKISEQNNFSSQILKDFELLDFNNKICFTSSSTYTGETVIRPVEYEKRMDIDINDEPRIRFKNFDLIKYINEL